MASRIGLKLGIGYALLIAFVMTCVGYYLVSVTRNFVISKLRERLVAECNLVHETYKQTSRDQFVKLAPALEKSIGARITIIKQTGQVIVETDAPATGMDPHNTRPEVVDALETGTGWALRKSLTLNTNLLYVARHYGPQEPVVRLAMPLTSVDYTVAGVQRAIILVTLAAALLCVIGGFIFTHNVTHSLTQLTLVARRLGAGELETRVSLHNNDETGELANAFNVMATRLASAHKRLEEQAAHLRAMLSQMADGIVAVGPDETVQIFNKSAGELLQTNPQDALGRRLSEVALNYELVEVVRRSLRLRTMGRAEVDTSRESTRILAAAVSPVEGEDGSLIGAVMALRDMTEIRRLESVRQDFVANASHELRTPVAAVRSLAETLSGGAINDPEVAPRFLEQIVSNTENLALLLDDMMTLARLEATQHKPEPNTVNISKTVAVAVSRLEPQARGKRIRVITEAPEDLFAWCAEDDLTAALVNLVDNAIKYTPEDGRVEIEASALDDQVRISVTDTGPGIPENLRTRIFERFYRVDKGRSRALGGTGLGLSIVKHAIESSGGRVWVEDGPDGGACFVILLSAGPCQVDVE